MTVGGREDLRVRQRHGGRPDGRRVHRVHGHRDRGRHHRRLDLPEAEKNRMLNNIPVAYAVSYLVGTGFVVWFLSSLAPRLLRVNLKAESRKLAAQMSSAPASEPDAQSAYREWDVRALRLGDGPLAGRPVAAAGEGVRAGPRLRRADPPRRSDRRCRRPTRSCTRATSSPSPPGGSVFAERHDRRRRKWTDRELLDFPVVALDVVVTNRALADQPAGGARRGIRARRHPAEARARRRGDPVRSGDRS